MPKLQIAQITFCSFTSFSSDWWCHFCLYTSLTLKPAAVIVVIRSDHPNICWETKKRGKKIRDWVRCAQRLLCGFIASVWLVINGACWIARPKFRPKQSTTTSSSVFVRCLQLFCLFCWQTIRWRFNTFIERTKLPDSLSINDELFVKHSIQSY